MSFNIHVVIMAGGSGTRFWPGSRANKPKQLLDLVSENSLLQDTIKRVLPLTKKNLISVVTSQKTVKETKKQAPDINIIAEPVGRNTAPCIGYMAFKVAATHSPNDVVVVLPSDHHIKNNHLFLETIMAAVSAAYKNGAVVTIGIKPAYAHTGYGYINAGEKVFNINDFEVHKVKAFKEKPNKQTAEQFVNSGDYYWNSGMFVFKAGTMIEAIKNLVPDLYSGLNNIAQHFNKPTHDEFFNNNFGNLPAESIDYAVIEKLENTLVIQSDFGWNDLGSWPSLEDLLPKKHFGVSNTDNITSILSSGNVVHTSTGSKKIIALLDVNDLIIVDTPDALLVASKKEAQKIKDIVSEISKNKLNEYL